MLIICTNLTNKYILYQKITFDTSVHLMSGTLRPQSFSDEILVLLLKYRFQVLFTRLTHGNASQQILQSGGKLLKATHFFPQRHKSFLRRNNFSLTVVSATYHVLLSDHSTYSTLWEICETVIRGHIISFEMSMRKEGRKYVL